MGPAGGAIGGMLLGLLMIVALGAIVLRGAVALFNLLAGGDKAAHAVPRPTFLKAMGIAFLTFGANTIVRALIGATASVAAPSMRGGIGAMLGLSQIASLAAGAFVMSGLLTVLLPTTFGRAFLITLCNYFIWLIVIAIFFGVMFTTVGGF